MDTLELEPHASGVILPVKAAPGSKKNELRPVTGGALKVCCTQIPEKGKANRALIEVLARFLKLRKSQISLFSGEIVPPTPSCVTVCVHPLTYT